MKKVISFGLALAMLLSFCGCKSEQNADEPDITEEGKNVDIVAVSTGKHEAYLIDDTYYFTVREKPMSGWTYDGRGAPKQTTETGVYNSLADVSTEYGAAYIREFNETDTGVITLETVLTVYCQGTYQEFRDKNDNVTYGLYFNGETWSVLNADGIRTAVAEKVYGDEYRFKIILDLDNGKAKTYVNDVDCGESDLLSDNIINYRFGTDEEHTGSVTRAGSLIYANFAVYDTFSYLGAESAYGWTLSGKTRVTNAELNVLNGDVVRTFAPLAGNICAETYFLLPKNGDMTLALSDDDDKIILLHVEDGTLKYGSRDIYTLTENMWYRLRIEADAEAGTADILLNGRMVANIDIPTKNRISALTISADNARFDNIKIYNIFEADDYVPAPEVPANDDYLVGMLSCNLWHTGFDEGWNLITAYDDRKPVLGYYDEGIPEVADWETKYMVEHGVDFQVYCWYNDAETGAVKTPYRVNELHDGYMYSKYSSYLKYAIMWETQSQTSKRVDMTQFKNNIVPYWFENYFLDGRYLVIDNKPVLYIYQAFHLFEEEYFGSVEAVAEAMEYLEKTAKDYGFDGILLCATGEESDISKYIAVGLDGMFSYGFGQEDSTSPVINGNTKIANGIAARTTEDFRMVPSISTGFNNIPFSGTRTATLSEGNFRTLIQWAKQTYLPQYVPKGSWAEGMIIFSNWNEYGEGKYIMPTEKDGFQYLDVIRSEIVTNGEHTDVLPTESQKERLTRMFPQYQSRLYCNGYYAFGTLKAPNAVADAKLYIDGNLVKGSIPAMSAGSRILFAVDESTGVNYMLNSFMTWRRAEGMLKFEANHHTVIFTVGSDVYTVDGEEYTLDFKIYTFDGLVMLPFDTLAQALGYRCQIDGTTYSILTA